MPDLTSKAVKGSYIADKLIWLDMEMSGLDPEKSKILEIAGVVTDINLNEIDKFEFLVHYDYEELMKSFNKWWLDRGEATITLAKACEASKMNLAQVEKRLIQLVKKHFGNDPAIISGSSIRMDRNFIDYQMPKFADKLHYRTLDVSSFKILFEAHGLPKRERLGGALEGTHRALDDIYDSIALLKYYIEKGWINFKK